MQVNKALCLEEYLEVRREGWPSVKEDQTFLSLLRVNRRLLGLEFIPILGNEDLEVERRKWGPGAGVYSYLCPSRKFTTHEESRPVHRLLCEPSFSLSSFGGLSWPLGKVKSYVEGIYYITLYVLFYITLYLIFDHITALVWETPALQNSNGQAISNFEFLFQWESRSRWPVWTLWLPCQWH